MKKRLLKIIENIIFGIAILIPLFIFMYFYSITDFFGRIVIIISTIVGYLMSFLMFSSGYMSKKVDEELRENYEFWKDDDYPVV